MGCVAHSDHNYLPTMTLSDQNDLAGRTTTPLPFAKVLKSHGYRHFQFKQRWNLDLQHYLRSTICKPSVILDADNTPPSLILTGTPQSKIHLQLSLGLTMATPTAYITCPYHMKRWAWPNLWGYHALTMECIPSEYGKIFWIVVEFHCDFQNQWQITYVCNSVLTIQG